MEGIGVVAAREAVGKINEGTQAYVVMSIDDRGQVEVVTGGGIGDLSFLAMTISSLCHEILARRDPRHKMEIPLRAITIAPSEPIA